MTVVDVAVCGYLSLDRITLPTGALHKDVPGGVIYTAGIAFYALSKRVAHMHALWHVFVVGGSIAHYVVVFRYVALS